MTKVAERFQRILSEIELPEDPLLQGEDWEADWCPDLEEDTDELEEGPIPVMQVTEPESRAKNPERHAISHEGKPWHSTGSHQGLVFHSKPSIPTPAMTEHDWDHFKTFDVSNTHHAGGIYSDFSLSTHPKAGGESTSTRTYKIHPKARVLHVHDNPGDNHAELQQHLGDPGSQGDFDFAGNYAKYHRHVNNYASKQGYDLVVRHHDSGNKTLHILRPGTHRLASRLIEPIGHTDWTNDGPVFHKRS
jgi:hypothetical protein